MEYSPRLSIPRNIVMDLNNVMKGLGGLGITLVCKLCFLQFDVSVCAFHTLNICATGVGSPYHVQTDVSVRRGII